MKTLSRDLPQLAEALHDAADAVFLLGKDGTFLYQNAASQKLFRPDDHSFVQTVSADEVQQARLWLQQLLSEPESAREIELQISSIGGSTRRVHLNAKNLLAKPGVNAIVVTCRDVTDLRKREEALQASEALYRSIVENGTAIITVIDQNGRIILDGAGGNRTLGFTPEELKGRNVFELVHPEDQPAALAALASIMTQPGAIGQVEVRLRAKDGSWRHAQINGKNMMNDPGVAGIVYHSTDITRLKEAQAALAASERRFRALTEKSADPTVVIDAQGRIIYETFGESSLGYAHGLVVGWNARDLLHADDAPVVASTIQRLLEEPSSTVTVKVRIRGAAGEWRWFECVATNQFEEPAIGGIVINARDITDQKKAEDAYRQNHMLLQTIIESIPARVFVKDREGRYLLVNTAAARGLGKTIEEVIGKDMFALAPQEYATETHRKDLEVLSTGLAQTYESTMTVNGQTWVGSIWKCPYRNAAGDIIGIVGMAHDITERKQHEAEIERLNAELEQRVNQRTSQLTAAIIQLRREFEERRRLERDVLTISEREQQRIGNDLHDGLQQELAGIACLCDALTNRLDAEKLPHSAESESIAALLRKSVFHARGLAHGLRPVDDKPEGLMRALERFTSSVSEIFNIKCTFRCRTPVLLNDSQMATHLYRIAQEAVHNTIKHSGATRVTVGLKSKRGEVEFTVRDNGRGMPEQRTKSKTMGLETMAYRAQAIGGSLELRSVKPKGTLVVCTIPAGPKTAPRASGSD